MQLIKAPGRISNDAILAGDDLLASGAQIRNARFRVSRWCRRVR
jgi:hypothetical protein